MRNKQVSALLTDEEYKRVIEAVRKAEDKKGERLTVSNFLREVLIKHISSNGNSPAVQDSEHEIVAIDSEQDSELSIKAEMPAKKSLFDDMNF